MNSQYRNAASLALLCSFQCYSICHVHYDCTLASISRFKQIRFGYNYKINIFKFIIANEYVSISQGTAYKLKIRNMKHCETVMKRLS